MTEEQVQDYLRDNGYPEHLVRAGAVGLIRSWGDFVAQVEHGYPFSLYDYRNDLDVRAILRLAGAENDAIHALDERLKPLLIEKTVRVWESAEGEPFWDFGYPGNAGPELLEDLRSEELI